MFKVSTEPRLSFRTEQEAHEFMAEYRSGTVYTVTKEGKRQTNDQIQERTAKRSGRFGKKREWRD